MLKNDNYKKLISEYIEAHTQEMISDIIGLCSIASVKGESAETAGNGIMPYGEGTYRALMAAEGLCRKYGLSTKNYYNRVVAADMTADKSRPDSKCLDILVHMDVVAPEDGWTVTEAFKPVIKENVHYADAKDGTPLCGSVIYGRGTSDDKGPAVAALYAMRAVKELGLPVSRNCRLILGSDEETGSSDIEYYYKDEKEAPMTFSPDAEFPLINIEKGQFRGFISINTGSGNTEEKETLQDRVLISCVSGDTINIVPGKGSAELSGFAEEEIISAINSVKKETNSEFKHNLIQNRNKDGECSTTIIEIKAQTAHASTPEKGVNAAVILLHILSKLEFDSSELNRCLSRLKEIFPYGDYTGRGLGIEMSDPESGNTSATPDILIIEGENISVKFDSRTCIGANYDNTVLPVKKMIEAEGWDFDYTFVPPHAVDGGSIFIRTLLDCYETVTGVPGKCAAEGGGTYVHRLENGVAFGAVGETTDTHMHGADEFMPVKELQDAAVIYALAIAELCR